MLLDTSWSARTVSNMRLSRTFVSGILLSTLALASCSSSVGSEPQDIEPTTTSNSPAVTTIASSLVVRPVLQIAKLEDPAAVAPSVSTAPGTAILTGRNGIRYLVGSFDSQDGIFKPGAYVGPKVVDGVASWVVTLEIRNEAAWSEITKACSALAPSCPTGQTALIADGQVIFAPSFPAEDFGYLATIELSGFANEAAAREVAFWLQRGSGPSE